MIPIKKFLLINKILMKAGHVLGAAMFMIEIAGVRILYTGDFSRVEDRHLMAAELPTIKPDVLIIVRITRQCVGTCFLTVLNFQRSPLMASTCTSLVKKEKSALRTRSAT